MSHIRKTHSCIPLVLIILFLCSFDNFSTSKPLKIKRKYRDVRAHRHIYTHVYTDIYTSSLPLLYTPLSHTHTHAHLMRYAHPPHIIAQIKKSLSSEIKKVAKEKYMYKQTLQFNPLALLNKSPLQNVFGEKNHNKRGGGRCDKANFFADLEFSSKHLLQRHDNRLPP